MKVAFYKFINAKEIKRVLSEYKNEKRNARVFLDKVHYFHEILKFRNVNNYEGEQYDKYWALYRKHHERMCELIAEYNRLTHICESGYYPAKLTKCYAI